jgi:glycerol kinase
MKETTALGAALAAGLSTGVFNDLSEFQPGQSGTVVFNPRIAPEGMLSEIDKK